MAVEIRKMRADESGLLPGFLYEAIFIPEGVQPPDKDIVERPELRVYYDGFGTGKADFCVVAEDTVEGRVIGAAWSRIMNDYGHVDDETPSIAISLYKEYRGRGIGTDMLAELLGLLESEGFTKVSLAVQKANYAVRMYMKAGFVAVSESGEEFLMVRKI